MSDRNAIIRAKGVTKTYDTGKVVVEALRGVDLEVREGEMVAVMGPSGSGKTTLLNTLSGLDEIDAGVIEIDGRDLAQMSDRARTKYRAENMGFVFQFYNLLPVLSAVENVEMPLLLNGHRLSAKEARRQAQAALEAVQLYGGYGFSDEYPVERYLRNAKGAVLYEGSSEIQTLIQADYALGYRKDKPLRCELPAYDEAFWQDEV